MNQGQGANGFQPSAGKQKKENINKVELIGYITPRSSNENDKIDFYPFKNGGGAVHCSLKVLQPTGQADENGNPRIRTTYVPIDVTVNKLIPATVLQGLVSGMKVKVVGELRLQSYEKKGTNQKVSTLAVSVYVLEVLETPMQAIGGYAGQYMGNPPTGMPAQTPGYAPAAPGYQPTPYYQQVPQGQPYPQSVPAMGGMPGMPPGYAPSPQGPQGPQGPQAPQQMPQQAQPQYNQPQQGFYPGQGPIDDGDLPMA